MIFIAGHAGYRPMQISLSYIMWISTSFHANTSQVRPNSNMMKRSVTILRLLDMNEWVEGCEQMHGKLKIEAPGLNACTAHAKEFTDIPLLDNSHVSS